MLSNALVQRILNAGIEVVQPTIIDELDHDTEAFTQGLAFSEGALYESTGLDDASSIRRLNPVTGEIEINRPLHGHWGEGVAVSGERVVQLTWKSNRAVVYNRADLSPVEEWPYRGEGWGLAATADGFVMTDGSERLYYRDRSFAQVRTVSLRRKALALRWLNDLEMARGSVWVHRASDAHLFEVDPERGSIRRLVDCSGLVARAAPKNRETGFNGIAYDPSTNLFYLTGKRWSVLFKVRIATA